METPREEFTSSREPERQVSPFIYTRDHLTGNGSIFVFVVLFVFDKFSAQAEGIPLGCIPYLCAIERLMCEVEFFGRCCIRGRYVRRFFMWVGHPLTHYQIVDLEDIDYCF